VGVFYNNCFMPGWFPATYAATIIILAFVVLLCGLFQLSRPRARTTINMFGTVCVGLACIIAYGVALSVTGVTTNVVSWAIYLLLMVIHVCILVPMVARFLIPPVYRMVLVYPKWFDISLGAFVAFASISLVYSWIFALIGLATGDAAMFNNGIHIWLASCAWLTFQITLTITIATKQLIAVVDHIFPRKDPFFKDLSVLKKRAVTFGALTLGLGTSTFALLFVMAFLHFYDGVFAYRFVLFWILSLFLILFDAIVIWFTRSGSTKNTLSTPKSSVGLENEPMIGRISSSIKPSFRQAPRPSQENPSMASSVAEPQKQYPNSIVGVSRNPTDRRSDDSFVDIAVV